MRYRKKLTYANMAKNIIVVGSLLCCLTTIVAVLAQQQQQAAISNQQQNNEVSNNNNNNNNASRSDINNNNNNQLQQQQPQAQPQIAQQPQQQQQQQQQQIIKTSKSLKSNNYKPLYEICKVQSKIGQQITNLTQIMFHPSDICSSYSTAAGDSITTATAAAAATATTTPREDHPWFYIEHLNLSQNNLTVLHDSSSLNKLVNLLELKITFNQLVRCAENSLNGMRRLQSLDLSHNRLPGLPPKFFQSVKATIKKINLSFNSISVLHPSLFESLIQLEYLDLSHNDITSHWINDEIFKNLTQLHHLDLSFNKLTVISPPGAFSSLQQLETLTLQHNELSRVPETIQYLRYLSSLDLSQNSIHDITNASYLSNCRLLFNLNLESNLLENITRDAFSDLPALKVLNLANNRIHHLDQQAFDYVPDLHALRLDSNHLVDFGQAFVNLRFLLMLNISSNRISSFDYAQIPLGLQWLDLHSNKIDKLNNFYYSPSAQQQLNLANDQQQQNSIGQQWQSMLRLTTLDASYNLLAEIDNTSLPESLETVQLNNNQIRNIASHTFSTKSNLTRINLSNNRLSIMPYEALMLHGTSVALPTTNTANRDIQQQKFVDIYLANNPYLCNCNMGWLSQLLLASSTMASSLNQAATIINNNNNNNNGNSALREHQLIMSRQLPRVADAHLVTCHLPLARQSPLINMDPHQWSPVMAANQLAQHHNHHLHLRPDSISQGSTSLIVKQSELLSSVHLCPYKSHCFAMCFCCDFDACDCEMSCPENCSCYYGQNWSTNIVDCSANNQIQSSQALANLSRSSSSSSSQMFIHRPTNPVKFYNIPDKIPMDVTELYLDGLELRHLRGNSLIGRRNLKSLYLNNSQVQSIEQKAFATQTSLKILQLNSNFLTKLFGYEFEQQVELRELYLAHNQLTSIANSTFASLRSLQILHLQNNQLYQLNLWSNLPTGHRLISVNLGSNPWSCQCDYVEPMLKWLRANTKHLHDRKSISCRYNRTQALHLMPPLLTSSAMVADFEDSLVAYESSSGENYPMFDVRMCLNHTVYPVISNPIVPLQGPQDEVPLEYLKTNGDDRNSSISNDEPYSRPVINDSTVNNFDSGFIITNHVPSPSPAGIDSGITPIDYRSAPQATSKTSNILASSPFLLGAISMMFILVVVILSLVHYRRSMSMWFYSRYGLNMFSAHTKPTHHHHHHAVGSLSKHSALHHPHLHHHHNHHNQYGASSSAGSTSSSSAASSNLSQALCQQQLQNSAAVAAAAASTAAASGLVTTPLIVTNNNSHQLLNSTATTTTTAASTATASSPYNDEEKLFDAYLTYSRADEQFINDNIAPELEYGQPSYRVALHYRDLPATTNEFLTDCIIETANASRRMIMVLSEQLLKTEWRNYEFRTAHLEALRNNYRHRLIIVMLGQPQLANIDPEMLHWLKNCACIQWGDKMFWQRLRFSMPDLPFNRQQPQYMRYQTMGLHNNNNNNNNRGATSTGKQAKGGNLGANLLKSAGLLVGNNNHHQQQHLIQRQQQPLQQLVTASSLARPLPQPGGGGGGMMNSHNALLHGATSATADQEQHHYAHLTPATMIYNQQQQQLQQQHQQLHTYHQPIYGDPQQQQQHQQAATGENPVHI